MIPTVAKNLTLVTTLGPSLAIAVLYGLFIYRPLNHQITAQQSVLRQVHATMARIDSEAEQKQLVELQKELTLLSQQTVETKNQQSTLVTKRRDMSASVFGSTAPAGSIAQMISIGQSAGLVCLSVQPQKEPTATIPDQLKMLAAEATPKNKQKDEHCEVVITLSGSYMQMQSALSSLAEQALSAKILSLNMSPIDGQPELRRWQWVVWLRSELP